MDFNYLKKFLKNDFSDLPVIKIAVLADSASQLFSMALRGYGYYAGLNLKIWEADYNQILLTVLEDGSGLYTNKPDFVIINQSSIKLLDSFYKKDLAGKQAFSGEQLQFVETLRQKISEKLDCSFIFINYAEINDSVFGNFANKLDLSFLYQIRKSNVGLMDFAIRNRNVHICDLSTIQNRFGSINTISEKLYITTENVLEIDMLPVLVKNITDIILAGTGRFKKCLILDLDNTTWGGVIGDDGLEGIQIGDLGIGKAFTNLQKWVLQLKKRGIIIAVCSKNTEEIAMEPFKSHPDMVLKLEDIAMFVANWENKADNIRYIQSVLNIGFDSMVFLDDNPVEREIIRQELPAVTVPELPEDPVEYLSYLTGLNLFETSSFTEADVQRNDQYKQEAGRTALLKSITDEAGFLRSLEMTSEVKPIDNFTLPRAAQLTQRSNQFNLRTIRYSDEQMKKVTEDDNKFSMAVSLKDKFGDYGLISLLILEKKSTDTLFIDTWIMSCRVLKRNVEDFLLNKLILLAKEQSCNKIIGEYIATPKNGIVQNLFYNFSFRQTEDGLWMLETDGYTERQNFINSY